jgi:hypothetical protein
VTPKSTHARDADKEATGNTVTPTSLAANCSSCRITSLPASTFSYARCALTFVAEQDPGHSGPEKQVDPVGVRVPEQIRRRVASAVGVEDGPADLGPGDVVVREPAVRQHAGLQEAPPHGGLPRAQRRLERHDVLHPPVRRQDLPGVPPDGPDVPGAGAREEPGVDAAAAAQHARAGVDHAVLGHEPLRWGRRRRVRQHVREVEHAQDAPVLVGRAAALQEEHARALRQRRGKRATRRAAADDDVVVVGHRRRVHRLPHEGVVHSSCCHTRVPPRSHESATTYTTDSEFDI